MEFFLLPQVEQDTFSDFVPLAAVLVVTGVLRPELEPEDVDPVGVFLPDVATTLVGVFLPVTPGDRGFLSVVAAVGVLLPETCGVGLTHPDSPAFTGCLAVGGTGERFPLVVPGTLPDPPPADMDLCIAPLPPGMMAALPITIPLGPLTTLAGSLEADLEVFTVVLAVLTLTSLTAGTRGRLGTLAAGGVSGSTALVGGAAGSV